VTYFIHNLWAELIKRFRGMSLTAAEKLQAVASPMAQWISQLQTVYVDSDGGLADHIKWDTARGNSSSFLDDLLINGPNLNKVEISRASRN